MSNVTFETCSGEALTCKLISGKRARHFVDLYNNYNGCWSLYSWYDTWSCKKEIAYDRCYTIYLECRHSVGFAIISANTSYFTAAFKADKDGSHYLVVMTYANDYTIKL